MSSVSRFLLMEKTLDITDGHEDAVAMVEDILVAVEGERRSTAPEPRERDGGPLALSHRQS